MKIDLRPLTLATVVLVLLTGAAGAQEHDGPWHHSFTAAQEFARQSGRPLLINFGGPGCGPCERMTSETLGDDAVAAVIYEHFEAAHVNSALQPELATRYLVSQFPTIKFMYADGTVVHDHRGFAVAERFLKVMEKALVAHEALLRARSMAEEAGEDTSAEVAAQISRDFLTAQQHEDSAAWARRALDRTPDDAVDLRAKLFFVLGVALAEGGDPGAAVEPLQTALALDADAPWGWQARLNLGYAWLQTDERDKGGELLREVAAAEDADAEIRDEARLLLRWVGLDTP